MWLLPAVSLISNAAARVYYRLTIAGEPVPHSGPVLLVANHPNSLLDPVLVAAAAGRPVRFLAKSPLFADRAIGWLVRGAGAIPVYRREDDATASDRNVDMFRAAYHELSQNSAVGIFPEGLTHGEPQLAKLKTGAARIALGAAERGTRGFPIVPVGLVFRRKDAFRSLALIVRGPPVEWSDLYQRSPDDRDAVRELTQRIEASMRRVTVNLEQWEDRPLVECAEAIWTAEWGADKNPAVRVGRLRVTTSLLKRLRLNPEPRWETLLRDLSTHCGRLERLRLRPHELAADVRIRTSVRWSIRRLPLVGLPAVVLAVIGYGIFWLPRFVTVKSVQAAAPHEYRRSTYALFIGIVVYASWIVFLTAISWRVAGLVGAAVVFIALPLSGLVALWIRERWRGSWADVRRFLLLRSRGKLIRSLKSRQRELAARLKELQGAFAPE